MVSLKLTRTKSGLSLTKAKKMLDNLKKLKSVKKKKVLLGMFLHV